VLNSAMNCAVRSMLKSGQVYMTAELKVNFARPAREQTGKLRCEGKIAPFGGRLATSEARLTAFSDNLIARGSEVCMIVNL